MCVIKHLQSQHVKNENISTDYRQHFACMSELMLIINHRRTVHALFELCFLDNHFNLFFITYIL